MKLLGLPRRYKRMLQVAADVSLVWLSLWLAFLVRLGTEDMISPFGGHAWLFIAAPLVAIPLFIRFGMYRAVMRYLGNDALIAIAKAVTISFPRWSCRCWSIGTAPRRRWCRVPWCSTTGG